MAALKYWVWLQTLNGVSHQGKLALLEHFISPEEIYLADEGDFLQVEDFPKEQIPVLLQKSMKRADEVLSDCVQEEIFLVTMDDALYPNRLRNIYDPPLLLYGKGKMPLFDEEVAIAMVGTRNCTPYGEGAAENLGYGLSKQGAVVVSGIAKGIDTAALRGALRAGGFTVAVLGGGIDVIYPAENRALYQDIAATGVLLSEYPPHTEPEGWHFPIRNRIISGLSLGTVVVEAPKDRSGALITAHTAAEQGKDVFAVPGPYNAPRSQGCFQLIREGAILADCAEHILEEYVSRYPHKLWKSHETLPPMPDGDAAAEALTTPLKTKKEKPQQVRPEIDLTDGTLSAEQVQVLQQIPADEPLLSDEIALCAGLSIHQTLSALTLLELSGYIIKTGARSFLRTVDIKKGIEDTK